MSTPAVHPDSAAHPVRAGKVCINHPDRKVTARGLCGACYHKFMRSASPKYAERYCRTRAAWLASNRERLAGYSQKWNAKHPDQRRHVQKVWDAAHPHARRHNVWVAHLRRYGLTPEMYEAFFHSQAGVCAICGRPPQKKRLAVDHCHDSEDIRGLLCDRCNRGLGFFLDDPAIIARAAEYLARHKPLIAGLLPKENP